MLSSLIWPGFIDAFEAPRLAAGFGRTDNAKRRRMRSLSREMRSHVKLCGLGCKILGFYGIWFTIVPMVRQSDAPASIEFGHFSILPHRRQLLADGRPITLGGRAFDVLMALIEASGAVVSKDELLNQVWQGRIVEENRLAGEISALRKAFGADRDLIRTVAGRGYQFTGEIRARPSGVGEREVLDAAAGAPSSMTPVGPGSVYSEKPSIAAPLFTEMTGDPEREDAAELKGVALPTRVFQAGLDPIGETRTDTPSPPSRCRTSPRSQCYPAPI
jgi:DNA-binding winged helix-turn-helix (wHTH) protein